MKILDIKKLYNSLEFDFLIYAGKFRARDGIIFNDKKLNYCLPGYNFTDFYNSIIELPDKILRAEEFGNDKSKSQAFLLNKLQGDVNIFITGHTSNRFDFPHYVFIDVDFHDPEQENIFKKEYKYYNSGISLLDNLEVLKEIFSGYSFISANSFSGKGLRFICVVVNYKNTSLLPKNIHKSNCYLVCEKFKEITGLNINDRSILNITQPTYTCRKTKSIVNWNPYEFDNTNLYKSKHIEDEENLIIYSRDEVDALNTRIYKQLDYVEIRYTLLSSGAFRSSVAHHDTATKILYSLSVIKNDDLLKIFYDGFKNFYKGNSIPLTTYISFKKYLHQTKWLKGYQIPIENILIEYGITLNTAKDGYDRYGFKFDKEFKYNDYITEKKDIINNILEEDRIVMKSPTGSAKTTCVLECLNSKKGLKIFITPTNVIADQTVKKCVDKGYKYIKGYGGNKPLMMNYYDDNIILITNLQNLKRYNKENFTNAVFDECHKIIDYAIFDEEQFIFPNCKHLFMSATPEIFLIGLKDFKYYNFKPNENKKKRIIMHKCGSVETLFKTLSSSLRQAYKNNTGSTFLIFNNNKDKNKKLQEYYSFFDFKLIDSSNKNINETYKKLINDSILNHNIITTSLINDGVNILNKKWDYVFILDNFTQSTSDIYQFVSRFRFADPQIHYLYQQLNNKEIENIKLFSVRDRLNEEYELIKKDYEKICFDINQNYTNFSLENIKELKFIYYNKNERLYKINKNLIKKHISNKITKEIRFSKINFNTFLSHDFKVSYDKFYEKSDKTKVLNTKEIINFVTEEEVFINNYIDKNESDLVQDFLDIDKFRFINQNKTKIKLILERLKKINILKNGYDSCDLMFDVNIKDVISKNYTKFQSLIRTLENKLLKETDKKRLSASDKKFKDNYKLLDDIFDCKKINGRVLYEDFITEYNKEKEKFIEQFKIDVEQKNKRKFTLFLKEVGFSVKRHRNVNYVVRV